jgi:eukaryotic-like serine/threonine-protein kinase
MAGFALAFLRPRPSAPVVSFRVASPENTNQPGPPSISPDGRLLALPAAGSDGRRMLWLRALDDLRMTPIPGSEGANAPFWSPDSKYIGFFASQSLKKVPSAGGPVITICPAESIGGGGAWNSDDTILFAPGMTGGLYRVAASGGTPEPLLELHAAKFERAFLWPQFLPGNKHFIFFVSADSVETTGVYAGSIASGRSYRLLFASETNAVFSGMGESGSRQNGYLLFVRGRTPMAQAFHASSLALEGEPISIGDNIGSLRSLLLAPISVSNNGILVYQTVGDPTRQMVWMNRSGKPAAVVKETGDWGPPRISPRGTRAVAARLASDGHADLWLLEADGRATQLTTTPEHEGSPVWSPNGSCLVFFIAGKTEGNFDLYTKPLHEGKAELLYKSDGPKYPTDWSKDGRYILFTTVSQAGRADVWAFSTADHRAGPILDTIYTEGYASLSPDGKWLAYQSDESGSNEVYVQSFDGITSGNKRRWRVSAGGGGMPRWRGDGKELFYVTYTGRMMALAVEASGGQLAFGAPQVLFQTRPFPKTWNLYDVSADGQHFLMNLALEMSNSPAITVLTNWTEKLKRVAVN